MEKIKKKKIVTTLIIIILLIAVLGASFAYFTATIFGKDETGNTVNTGTLSILYNGVDSITAENITPGWSDTKTFSVTNTGTLNVFYDINWVDVINPFDRKEDLVYSITGKYNSGERQFPSEDTNILKAISIEPGETQVFTLTMDYRSVEENQIIDMGKTISGKIQISDSANEFGISTENNKLELTGTGSHSIDFNVTNFMSATQSIAFKLNYVSNTYTDFSNVTYTLKKGNITLATGSGIKTEGIIYSNYILNGKTSENFSLTISYNGNDYEGGFEAIIEVVNLENAFIQELKFIEQTIKNVVNTHSPYIGTELTQATPINIRGLNYWRNWYLITNDDLESLGITTAYAPFIVKYTDFSVQSVPGEMIDGIPIHTINYTGEGDNTLYLSGILTAVDAESVASATQWGELTAGTGVNADVINPGGSTYDEKGGFILGSNVARLSIDQSRPVNQRYSVNFTVKGPIPQASSDFSMTIVAISKTSGSYLSWIGIFNNYLHIYSFYGGSAKSGINKEQYSDSEPGFISMDLTNIKIDCTENQISQGICDANNQKYISSNDYLNVQVTAQRTVDSTIGYTNIYINSVLIRTIRSGNALLDYGQATIGDLRGGRNLKYSGAIYNFALYSEVIDQTAITHNWNYTKWQLGI